MIRLKDKSDCCGCTSCESICSRHAIKMIEDSEGFKYPTVNRDLCIDCDLCNKVCPIEFRDNKMSENHYLELLAIRNNSAEELLSSSSGGFVSLLMNYVIENHGVVFGVAYNDCMEVIHTFSESIEGCFRFKGSKYVQSNISGIFAKIKEFLRAGRIVLFTGTPCQVEGLKLYLQKTYENLITVDLVCHAVPSPMIFREYISYLQNKAGEKVVDINMRFKGGKGWGHKFSYLYTFESGRQEVDWPKITDWGRLYFRNVITRESCHKCRFCNLNRPGDFTVADFWDDDNRRPEVFSKDGTSLVIINTIKAQKMKEYLKERFIAWHLSEEDAMQPCLKTPTPCNEERRQEYWRYYHKYGFEKYYNHFFTNSLYTRKRKMMFLLIKLAKSII